MLRGTDCVFVHRTSVFPWQNLGAGGTHFRRGFEKAQASKKKHQPIGWCFFLDEKIHMDVSAARDVSVGFQVQVDRCDIDESASFDIPVVKVGSSWYINVMSLD